ncbi:MAG: transposase, partial [Thermodesulfobacteriota bacterium]
MAGRTGQEYNQRKKRKGAFWEDRYHAAIIEGGEHLLRCIVYIDMNMVRAGVVDHPERWMHGGYNEIQAPRKKCVLIDYEEIRRLAGFTDFSNFQIAHRKWVNAAVSNSDLQRESMWTQSIAVGSRSFMALIKKKMNSIAIGRSIRQAENCSELREDEVFYNCFFGVENSDIGPQNTYCWN